MGRRSGFFGVLSAIAKESARQQRLAEAAQRRQLREMARIHRDQERLNKILAKEEKQRYLEERIEEVEEMNLELEERVKELQEILEHTLSKDDTLRFSSLRSHTHYPSIKLPNDLSKPLPEPQKENYFKNIKQPNWFMKLIPGSEKRYQDKCESAEKDYFKAVEQYKIDTANREAKITKLKKDHDEKVAAFEVEKQRKNTEIDELEKAYGEGDVEAVITYNTMVLERSVYPDDFPQIFKIAYVPESKELVVDYELPEPSVVPSIGEYKYVKTKDTIDEKPRKTAQIKEIYQDIVASVTLRTIHELFEADQKQHMDIVVFNGYVQTTDLATGKAISPFLISVRVSKQTFSEIDLAKVEKGVCLRNLGARVSPRPYEVQPVKPIVEFDMVDKRFVEQDDLLGSIVDRPNIYEMNPFEFENLVSNLFSKMGLEAKLTRSSKDGGVDVVAFDLRPVLGGKVIIQAKRYKNAVGVSAVRDLYGTMMNEGANKGILVTTSGYGPDAFEFAKDKPIELIDGGQLLYMLQQVGVEARIILPND
jgi:restriction system protein